LSELRQISTDYDNFWQKDGKDGVGTPDRTDKSVQDVLLIKTG